MQQSLLVIFTLMVLWSDMQVEVEYGQGYKSIAMCDGSVKEIKENDANIVTFICFE